MPKKQKTTRERRRILLERLEEVLADSVDTRRTVTNRLEREAQTRSRLEGAVRDGGEETPATS
jgi:hypothetical protein